MLIEKCDEHYKQQEKMFVKNISAEGEIAHTAPLKYATTLNQTVKRSSGRPDSGGVLEDATAKKK